MYKMSRGAERLIEKRKITVKKYSDNKIHSIYAYRKFTDEDYVIWVKMTYKNVYVIEIYAMQQLKKLKAFAKQNILLIKQVKKYKRKMGQRINDDKSVYIREDLAYKLIHYIILGVKEADEFRKNLGGENDKSIRIEREVIAVIKKIFAKESMVRQYQIIGLPYRVDLFCWS